MVLERLEPFGEVAADKRHGIAVAALANINRDPKRRPEAYAPRDFIPWVEQAKDEGAAELSADPEAQSRLIKQAFTKLQR